MQEEPKDRWLAPAGGVAALAAAGIAALAIMTATASPDTPAPKPIELAARDSKAGTAATVNCPAVANRLPAVPVSAAAEVQRNLALLQTQINEANNRLVSTVGQGGPNFIQNAILGPLRSKRVATIDRIAIAIGRTAPRPTGLESLATCTLSTSGAVQAPVQTRPPSTPSAPGGTGGTSTAPTVNCPAVANRLPAIPASAAGEVQRNLALLRTQINEANNRLVNTVGQGGPNFIQNAILGPLKSKRVATIDRIAIAIGRTAQRPTGLESLAPCTLNK